MYSLPAQLRLLTQTDSKMGATLLTTLHRHRNPVENIQLFEQEYSFWSQLDTTELSLQTLH